MSPDSAPDAGMSRSELGASSPDQAATMTLRTAAAPAAPSAAAPSGAATSGAATTAPRPLGGSGQASADWAAQLTHKVEEGVALIRDKTVTPVAKGVRYLILGIVGAFVGATVAVLFGIFSIRVLTTEVPAFHTRAWASWFVVAGIFWVAGLLLWVKRHPRS